MSFQVRLYVTNSTLIQTQILRGKKKSYCLVSAHCSARVQSERMEFSFCCHRGVVYNSIVNSWKYFHQAINPTFTTVIRLRLQHLLPSENGNYKGLLMAAERRSFNACARWEGHRLLPGVATPTPQAQRASKEELHSLAALHTTNQGAHEKGHMQLEQIPALCAFPLAR